MPFIVPTSPQLPFKANEGINIPSLPITDSHSIPGTSYPDSEEEAFKYDLDIELTPQRDLDLDIASTLFQQPRLPQPLIEASKDDVGDPYDKIKTRSQY